MISLFKFSVRAALVAFWIVVLAFFIYFSPVTTYFFKPSRAISIATWADYIDEDAVKEFEAQTGIKVYINFYENNEELLAKLELTKMQTYDLVIPTDSSVDILIKKGLLKKLDKQKLNFWHELDPRLLGKYFDPKNEYSIPYFWDILGIGYNKELFADRPPLSWGLLYDKNMTPGHVGMTDDPREVIFLAAQYLFGTIENLTTEKLQQVQELLLQQKAWVESYSDLRGEFLLYSKTCSVALIPSFQVWAGIKSGQFENIGFLVPKQPFMIIDSVVIPKNSSNTDLVYQFINFIYQKSVLGINAERHGFFTARKDLMDEKDTSYIGGMENVNTLKDFSKFSFFKNSIPKQKINDIWLALKAA